MHFLRLLTLVFGLLATPAQAVTVRVAPVERLVERVEYSAPARVVAEDHSLLSAQISGLIDAIRVRVGERVVSGQALVQLECHDYDLALQQARSNLDSLDAQIRLAHQQLERAKTLVKQRNVSVELRDQRQSELDQRIAERAGAILAIDTAQLAVKRCSVNAPFDGVVTERLAAEGSLAGPGTPLLRLLRDQALEVEAEVPLKQVESLRQAQVRVFVNDGHRYPLMLRSIVPLVESRTRTRPVRLVFDDDAALAGSSGRLIWQAPQPRLPASLMVRRGGQLGLMLFDDGRARFAPLPDAREGQAVAVDLPPGTLVIVEGQQVLNDGDEVER